MRRELGWIVAAGAAVLLAGCGSEQSEKELGMTEAERRAAERDEEKKREAKLFEESQR
jgi:uncharacterized lipoprotein YmbA